jgi:hypothetical protein
MPLIFHANSAAAAIAPIRPVMLAESLPAAPGKTGGRDEELGLTGVALGLLTPRPTMVDVAAEPGITGATPLLGDEPVLLLEPDPEPEPEPEDG